MFNTHKVRMNRLLNNGKCLDVAIDHGVCNEPSFLNGLSDMAGVVDQLIAANPDAIQMNYGQADLLQDRNGKEKPALVLRTDMGNPYNPERHRSMWAVLQNEDDPINTALQMDAACVVVNLFMLPDEPDLFRQCVKNIGKVRNACDRVGMPLMIEPLVMRPHDGKGGYMVDAEQLLKQGAHGMVYGRNIYQHPDPSRVVKALMAMIHDGVNAEMAMGIYEQG